MAHILYVTEGYCTHDRHFVAEMTKVGHEIWVLPCSGAAIRDDVPLPEGAIHRLPPLSEQNLLPGTIGWLTATLRFARVAKRISPDLIHAGPVQTSGFFAAVSGFHPLVIMSWGSDVLATPHKSVILKRITQFALKRADFAIADCEIVRRRISELGQMQANQIAMLTWGVDLNYFRPKTRVLGLREKWGWTGCKILISTRDFEPIHGTNILLKAFGRAHAARADIRLIMLGDGSLRKAAEEFVAANQLKAKVRFVGRVPEELLPDYFAESDLYVSATYCDGSSVSLLQAMACGLPAIVARGNGNNEWVTDGWNGWLYPAGDAEALSAKVLEALLDDAGRARAGIANIRIVSERADWMRNFTCVAKAYDQLLSTKRPLGREQHAQLQNW